MDETRQLAVMMPMMNDWASCSQLLADLDKRLQTTDNPPQIDVHVIDDFSIPDRIPEITTQAIRGVYVTRLVRNLGHQRAIAVGLVYLHTHYDYDAVIVMDSDGEDCADDVLRLIDTAKSTPDAVVVAQRKTRSEGLIFLAFYRLYKLFFRSMTGKTIDFGNFCLLPKSALHGLVYHPGIWNHLAATIVASRLPIIRITSDRCERYTGKSSMNFTSLVIHGMSATSIFLEQLAVRALILSLLALAVSIAGVLTVIWIRLYTDLAIPGWATSATGLLLLITGQTILVILFITFTILQQRSTVQIVPINEVLPFVASHQELA